MPTSSQPTATPAPTRMRARAGDDDAAFAAFLSSQGREIPAALLPQKRPAPDDIENKEDTQERSGSSQRRRTGNYGEIQQPHEYIPFDDAPVSPPREFIPPSTPSSPRERDPPEPDPQQRDASPQQRDAPTQTSTQVPPISDAHRRENFYASPTPGLKSEISEVANAAAFVDALKHATLDNSGMSKEDLARLRNPTETTFNALEHDLSLWGLRTFLSHTTASKKTYKGSRFAAQALRPNEPLPSFETSKKLVQELSGVIPIVYHMCEDTCVGFTGPYEKLTTCPRCGKDRYESNGQPRRTFKIIPLGPLIQALYASPESAERMEYRVQETERVMAYARLNGGKIESFNDIFSGTDYLAAVKDGRISPDDVVIQVSLDGAQLYRDKASDCWFIMYMFSGLHPDYRFTKRYVFPGAMVGGPEKPKEIDSFLFPILYHIGALQREGLSYWNAAKKTIIKDSHPFLIFGSADGPAMASMNGTVGAQGKFGCRLHCSLPGRRRPGDGHYFPALVKPDNYTVNDCAHPTVRVKDLRKHREKASEWYEEGLKAICDARTATEHRRVRLNTGICRPTIFSGLYGTLGIPKMFVMDIMHLVCINDPDLLLGLWNGTMKAYGDDNPEDWEWAVLTGKIWEGHGKSVALATDYLPSSFGGPRDIAKKGNSGYKANEFLVYLFALGPGLLRDILPLPYWQHYCKFVHGVQLLQKQRDIRPTDLVEGTRMLDQFVAEFEPLYCKGKMERLHFVRQSVHLLTHIGPETVRAGPLSCYAQWTMETLIGNLGAEIRSDALPYKNVENQGILRAQINSILAAAPARFELVETETKVPQYAQRVEGTEYVLLPRRQDTMSPVDSELEVKAIATFWKEMGWPGHERWETTVKAIKRWGRLTLPNGQYARSYWVEERPGLKRKFRVTRNVKMSLDGQTEFGEVQYFFRLRFDDVVHSLALVSMYSPPDEDLFESSYKTVYACHYQGQSSLRVVLVTNIDSVVGMVPTMTITEDGEVHLSETERFVVEKPYLDVQILRKVKEVDQEGDEDMDEEMDEEMNNE